MKNTTDDYSKLLDGRLPTSSLEFELCDRLIELQQRIEAGQHETIVIPQCVHYGDCPFAVAICEEDEPHCKCKYRELPS